MTPTQSGLALLPMIVGIFTTSIGSGQIMTRTGRYKVFPILGAAVTAIALTLLATIADSTPYWQVAIYVYFLGFGLGMTMQIVVTAVQNAVERLDMGAATSSVTFFRSMGGAFGTAIFGAVLATRLGHYLTEAGAANAMPAGGSETEIANDVEQILALPDRIREIVIGAWVDSVNDVFLVAVPFVLCAFVIAWFIPELRLKTAADS